MDHSLVMPAPDGGSLRRRPLCVTCGGRDGAPPEQRLRITAGGGRRDAGFREVAETVVRPERNLRLLRKLTHPWHEARDELFRPTGVLGRETTCDVLDAADGAREVTAALIGDLREVEPRVESSVC
jgi:hypothetical protein